MRFSVTLSLSLCSTVLAAVSADTTAWVQVVLAQLSVNTHCPLEHALDSSRMTHQHSKAYSHDYKDNSQNATSKESVLSSGPWTIYPTCSQNTTTQFCVFTSTSFHNNRGVSIITKPSIAQVIARSRAFSSKHKPDLSSLSENDGREPPFIVSAIPGKGMGMVATRTIERGELIKAHAAIGIFHNDAVDKASPLFNQHHASLMALAVTQLPHPSRDLFMAMAAHNESEEPIIERIYTNTFGEDFGDEEHSIVIPETARLNHDCRPNSMYYFDPKTLTHYTHAAKTIYKGEEITITYVDPLQTRLKRRAAIKRSWGFNCSCSLCSMEKHFVAESNRRILEINRLDNTFNETGRGTRRVQGSPEMAEFLVKLYEQERLWGSVASAYRLAALSWAARGREWEALRWGMKALDAGLVEWGPEAEDVRDMRRLVTDVRRHWSWGVNIKSESDK